jgi:hypothetical protein
VSRRRTSNSERAKIVLEPIGDSHPVINKNFTEQVATARWRSVAIGPGSLNRMISGNASPGQLNLRPRGFSRIPEIMSILRGMSAGWGSRISAPSQLSLGRDPV